MVLSRSADLRYMADRIAAFLFHAASSAAVSSANAAAASANAAAALIGEGMDGIVWKDTDESKRYLVKLRVVNGNPVMLYTEMEDNT